MVSLLSVSQEVKYPMLVFPMVSNSVGRLQKHFMYRHFQAKAEVVQEGEELLPLCELYRIHIPMMRLIKNQRTSRYDNNTQMWWRRSYVAIVDR